MKKYITIILIVLLALFQITFISLAEESSWIKQKVNSKEFEYIKKEYWLKTTENKFATQKDVVFINKNILIGENILTMMSYLSELDMPIRFIYLEYQGIDSNNNVKLTYYSTDDLANKSHEDFDINDFIKESNRDKEYSKYLRLNSILVGLNTYIKGFQIVHINNYKKRTFIIDATKNIYLPFLPPFKIITNLKNTNINIKVLAHNQ